MHVKHWTTLLFAGCLSAGGIARGQVAPPLAPEGNQEFLIESLPPAAPAAPQPEVVRAEPFPDQPGFGVSAGTAPLTPPPPLVQVRPGTPGGYGGGYRVIAGRQSGASWLGLAVSPAPEALRRQLRLRDGAGLVVEQVVPDGPADRAGIDQFDVLETLEDQVLTTPQELATIVRSHRAGDEVTLGIIREGKHREVTLKVSPAATRIARPPQPGLRFGGGGGYGFFQPGAPAAPRSAVPYFEVPRQPQMPGVYPPGTPAPRSGGGGSAYGSFKPGAPDAPVAPYPGVAPQPSAKGSSITLYFKGGQLFATIYDANGRIMMTGPVEALRNQKNLPRDARRALEQLRDDGARDGKDKPAKVRKHRKSQEDEDDDDDDAPRAR